MTLLGGDAELLTEGFSIGSYELFNKLISKQVVTGEDEKEESELRYLQIIKSIRDKEPDLFEKSSIFLRKPVLQNNKEYKDALLTYFRRGKLDKFFIIKVNDKPQELDFTFGAKLLESDPKEKTEITREFYELLDKNKEAFIFATTEEMAEVHFKGKGGRDNATNILKILKLTLKTCASLQMNRSYI